MTAGPLIAFGLVFASVSLTLSLSLNAVLLLAKPRLRRLGAWVERRAATAALLLPPLLALAVVTTLALESMLALAGGTDHCLGHDHHLHLCVRHGAAWLSEPWALSLVAATSTFVAVRFGVACWAHLMAQRASNRLRSLGTTLGDPRAHLVPSPERFAFTAGLVSPAVIISQGAWDALQPGERDAIVTHELASIFAIGSDGIFLDSDTKTMLEKGPPQWMAKHAQSDKVRRFLSRSDPSKVDPPLNHEK